MLIFGSLNLVATSTYIREQEKILIFFFFVWPLLRVWTPRTIKLAEISAFSARLFNESQHQPISVKNKQAQAAVLMASHPFG